MTDSSNNISAPSGSSTAQKPGLPLRIKLLFSTGDLSTSIPQAIIMFFQLYFLTDVAGLRPDLAGWAVAIGKIWDSINDPLFGLLSDRIRSKHGRRRVVLLYATIPMGVAFILMWIVPPLGDIGRMIYYALAFILFDTMYTLIHVSYNSLTPIMTRDYDERSSLNGFRMVFSIGGSLSAIILVTVLGWYISDSRMLFFWAGVGLGIISIIPPWIVFSVTRKQDSDKKIETLSIKEAIRTTLSNRPFWKVMGLYLFSWTAASVLAAVLVYFANYYLRQPEQGNYLVLIAQGSAILFIPLWVWLARRWDKRRAFIAGTASWVVFLIAFAFIQPDQVGFTYLLAFLSGSGIAVAYVLPWSMIPDIIEMDELQTRQRREGSYYAFASFFQKLGTGFAIWLMGQAMTWTGYITPSSTVPIPVQPEGALISIRLFASVLPAVLLIVSILFAWRYPISREVHRDMLARLDERK